MWGKWLEIFQHIPDDIWIKWCAIALGMLLAFAYLFFEQRRFLRYHQRLASHASSHDAPVIDYSIRLLALSTRNRTLFALSVLLLAASVVFYDVKSLSTVDDAPVTAPVLSTVASPTASQTVPEHTDGTLLDSLKQRYESAYIHYFYLHHCQKTDVNALALINSALLIELEATTTPARYAADIRSSAKGAYRELYGNASCDEETLSHVVTSHQTYLEKIRQSLEGNFNL